MENGNRESTLHRTAVKMVEQGGAMENILKMTKDTVKLEGWGKVDHCSTFCFLVVWTCEVQDLTS